MHILFLSDNFPPEVNAPASRTFDHCREWVRAGHRVTVITCAPNFPRGKVFAGYRNRAWQKETMDGIRVIRVWTYVAANEGFGRRILDYFSFMASGFIAALFVPKVDVVVGTSPQFFTAVAAYATGLVKRRPWVFELRDIWPESIRAVGAMRQSRLLDALERIELFLYRSAAAIVTVTHSFKRNLIARGIPESKIWVVTNGVDATRFKPCAKDPALVARLDLKGRFVAGYIGTHGLAHGLDTLIDAAALLLEQKEDYRIVILMLGDGAERQRLEDQAIAKGLVNMRFVTSVPKTEVPSYWSLLDASIIHLKKKELFKTVIPSKLFEAMGMGIPVLLGVEGETAEIVARHGVGLAFEPENAADLVLRLRELSEDLALTRRLARNGIEAARQFDRVQLAGIMLEVLEFVAKRGVVGARRA